MLSQEAINALLEVKRQKLERPETMDMTSFLNDIPPDDICGTLCCIAGSLVINNVLKNKGDVFQLTYEEIEGKAAEILGLTEGQAAMLFYLGGWNLFDKSGLEDSYRNAMSQNEKYEVKAGIAGRAIDAFIQYHNSPESEIIEYRDEDE